MHIAIQGFEGSFHQVAAENYFGKQTTIEACASFPELIRKVKKGDGVDAGIMAIERNSIAGSILPNYSLSEKFRFQRNREIYLQINQHLMVLPGQTMEDIREVHSHPMALLQYMDFLAQTSAHQAGGNREDTALERQACARQKLKSTAADRR